jgi:hypothetical protein
VARALDAFEMLGVGPCGEHALEVLGAAHLVGGAPGSPASAPRTCASPRTSACGPAGPRAAGVSPRARRRPGARPPTSRTRTPPPRLRRRMTAAQPVEQRHRILELTAPASCVPSLRPTPRKLKRSTTAPRAKQRGGDAMRDLVVERAAVERVRMADQCTTGGSTPSRSWSKRLEHARGTVQGPAAPARDRFLAAHRRAGGKRCCSRSCSSLDVVA